MRPLVYATRRSMLALAQCRSFVASLCKAVPDLETSELQVVTSGDRISLAAAVGPLPHGDRPLADAGGKGLFVKEIEEALLDRPARADFAVHSIKDVPGELPPGLVLACVPKREDPRDVLVAPRYRTLEGLPAGARVGTSSLRRMVSLKVRRPDLDVVPIRGNVDTRLRKVDAGECDAIVLARAGLVRLGLEERATQLLEPDVSLPAVGQGALGIECRADDRETREILSHLHDPETATCVAAERGVLVALGGDCKTPMAAHAVRLGQTLRLRAFVARPDGSDRRAGERVIPWPAPAPAPEEAAREVGLALGRELAG